MTTETVVTTSLAIVDEDGALVALPDRPSALALTLDEAERVFALGKRYVASLKTIIDIAQMTIEAGWRNKGQREGILGGDRYVLEAKPSPYAYGDELYEALAPFIDKVFTEDELLAASGRMDVPEHVQIVPAHTVFGWTTAKMDALARRSVEVARIVDEYRTRDEGEPRLTKKASR